MNKQKRNKEHSQLAMLLVSLTNDPSISRMALFRGTILLDGAQLKEDTTGKPKRT